MNTKRHTLAASAALLALSLPVTGQSLHFDGLLNSPIGSSSLASNSSGQLVVSNIGSSGLDGVRIDLGMSQGARLTPLTQLAPNESCTVTGNGVLPGSPVSVQLGLTMTVAANGTETFVQPDYSAIGQPTYTLRVYQAGQVVYELGGHTGATKLHNNPHQETLPHYVYVLTQVNGLPLLECLPWEGGTVTPPGGGVPIACDLVEFYVPSGPVISLDSVALQIDGPSTFLLESEEVRVLDHFVTGTGDSHLEPLNGQLVVSNIGSSGLDGVSIDLGGGDNYGECGLVELAATDHSSASCWLESTDSAGLRDQVQVLEAIGLWEFTPDFSALGAGTYTLELHLQGQLVFSQGGMTGPAVTCPRVSIFYKKKTKRSDGTTEAEWCIGGGNAVAHTVSGGPTILADMLILRSEGNTVLDDEVRNLSIRAADTSTDIVLTSITSTSPPCVGSSYCTAAPNSTGAGAIMCSDGSSSVADNNLVLTCSGMPAGQPGIFYYGPVQISIPFGDGIRCIGGLVHRLPVLFADASGAMSYALDNTSPPIPAGQIAAGQVWNFQCWYRDPAGAGSGFNLSDGHWILFTP